MAIVTLLVLLAGCATEKRCWKRYPPQVKDSVSYVEKVRDTTIYLPADSSMAAYLVECEETAEGLRARIVRLMTANPGTSLTAPSASITNNVLTTIANLPARPVKVQYKELHYSAVKSQVYVKVTNELIGWQWAQIWAGRILIAGVILLAGWKVARKYLPV